MMNDNPPDPAKAGRLAQQIVDVLLNEDSATRQRAISAAMMLLGEIALPAASRQQSSTEDGDETYVGLAAFFDREENMKPADHAQLCAAYLYSMYGVAAFSISELKALAGEAGVVLPDRVDMTLRGAMHKGKKLFQSTGSGIFKPTAAAGLHFAERWKVKPGRKTKTIASKGGADAETG